MFFEALNYETIEQKKAYEVAGLLGEFRPCFQSGILLQFGDINSHIVCMRVLSTLLQPLCVGFAGDIGGQMGLFIGASILTILELFDYAYEVSLTSFIHVCSRSNSSATFSAAHGFNLFQRRRRKSGG